MEDSDFFILKLTTKPQLSKQCGSDMRIDIDTNEIKSRA